MNFNNSHIALVLGIIALLFSILFHIKNKSKYAIATLVLGGLLLRVFVSLDYGLHDWDERYHALVAKNMINNPFEPKLYPIPVLDYDYKGWIGNYIWLHKPPMALWMIALSLKIFGVNEFAVRIPSIVWTSFSIYLVFIIGLFLRGRNVAFLAAFLFAINGFILELAGGRTGTDHIDSIFTSLFLLCIFLSIRLIKLNYVFYSLIVGICLASAILTKWIIAFFVLPMIYIVLLYHQFALISIIKRLSILIVTAILFALPWYFYIHTNFSNEAKWESAFNFMHVYKTIEGHDGNMFYLLDRIRINYHDLIYLPLVCFLCNFYKKPKDLQIQFLLVWFLIPLLFFSMVKTKMAGYLEFTAAAYFIIISTFWFDLYINFQAKKFRWIKGLLLFLLIALPIRYSIDKIRPFKERKELNWISELKQLESTFKGKYVLLNYKANIEAMFYTDLIVYDLCPTQELVEKILKKGYQVLINNSGKCDCLEFSNTKVVKLSEPD